MTAVYSIPVPGVLRPSSAPRWGRCAGSFALEKLYPEDEESQEAREGTAAHFWATEALQGREWPVGHLAPNGHPIDADMVEYGQLLLDEVPDVATGLHVEQFVTPHSLVHPECEGTLDVGYVDFNTHEITVWNYKYGHRPVDPFKNSQLLAHLAGLIERYELTHTDLKGWKVTLGIVQPRSFRADGPVKKWTMLGHVAWGHIEALQEAAYRAKEPGAPTTTGEHCRDCSGRHACEALQRVGAYVLDVSGESIPQELSPAALGLTLKLLDQAEQRLKALKSGLEEVAISKIKAGKSIPHWSIGPVPGREKWTKPAEEVLALGDLMGIPLAKPPAAITPTQARKAGLDPALTAEYAVVPVAHKLVAVDDNAAARAFS